MTNEEIRNEIVDAAWYIEQALLNLDQNDLDGAFCELETARCFIDGLLDGSNEDEDEDQ